VVHHNLPFHRAGFVGRAEERATLAKLIRRTGLVTVVGVGGVGKTRLSVQVAFDVMDDFNDGAWLVELASATDRQGIASAVAAVLHLTEVRGRSLEEVVLDHLSDKAALIVLDNCEQVLEAAAGFTEQLTRRSPNVVVIATSREPLAIDGEVIWRLEPLPVIEPGAIVGASDVAEEPAVALFEQRAAMARPGFRISDDNAADVARIVQQLDGIPWLSSLQRRRWRTGGSPVSWKVCQTGSRCLRTGGGQRRSVIRPCRPLSSGAWTSWNPTNACSSVVWPRSRGPAASTRPARSAARRP